MKITEKMLSTDNNKARFEKKKSYLALIGQFTVVCLVSEPLSEREAEVDLVLIKNSILF